MPALDADARVVNTDLEPRRPAAATDENTAPGRIANRVTDKIPQHRLEQVHVRAHPGAARHELHLQTCRARDTAELGAYAIEQRINGEVSNARSDAIQVQTRTVEQRTEQVVQRGQ